MVLMRNVLKREENNPKNNPKTTQKQPKKQVRFFLLHREGFAFATEKDLRCATQKDLFAFAPQRLRGLSLSHNRIPLHIDALRNIIEQYDPLFFRSIWGRGQVSPTPVLEKGVFFR